MIRGSIVKSVCIITTFDRVITGVITDVIEVCQWLKNRVITKGNIIVIQCKGAVE